MVLDEGRSVGERLYEAVLKGISADLQRIKRLGASEAAERELDLLIARLESDIPAA